MDNVELEGGEGETDLRDWSLIQQSRVPRSQFAMFMVRHGMVRKESTGRLVLTILSLIIFIISAIIFIKAVFFVPTESAMLSTHHFASVTQKSATI